MVIKGTYSMTRNGEPSGRSMNYDGENSDDAHEDVQNTRDMEDLSADDLAVNSSCEAKEEKSENHPSSTDCDPLVNSILDLQSVQEALENEIQKLGGIGNDPISLRSNSSAPDLNEPSSSDPLSSEIRQGGSSSLEGQVLNLTLDSKLLEKKLEKTMSILEAKESRISELESTLSFTKSPNEDPKSKIQIQIELEGILRQKTEAEVEYLSLIKTIQKLKVDAYTPNNIKEAETNAAILKKQAEELEKSCGDIIWTGEVSNMLRRVCKVTSFLFMQLILLISVFCLFVSRFSPNSEIDVPT